MTGGAEGGVIAGISVTPTHDGEAALVIELRFPGGGRSKVQMDGEGARLVLAKAQVDSAAELIGKPWSVLNVADTAFTGATTGGFSA